MKRLTSCCCFSARTGALILATLGIICAGFSLFSNGIMLTNEASINEMLEEYKEQFRRMYEEGEISGDNYQFFEAYFTNLQRILPYALVTGLASALFSLSLNSMMLCGIQYAKPCLMLPWLIIQMIQLVCITIAFAALIILLWVAGSVEGGFLVLGVGSLFLTIGYYLWHVVQSVYAEIKEKGEEYMKQPIVTMESPVAYDQLK